MRKGRRHNVFWTVKDPFGTFLPPFGKRRPRLTEREKKEGFTVARVLVRELKWKW